MFGINLPALTLLVIKILLTGIAFATSLVIFILLAILISRILKVKRDREHTIRLTNRGNFESYFFLSVAAPESSLRFGLSLNGVPLVPIQVAAEPQQASSQTASVQPRSNQAQTPAPAAQASSGQQKPAINAGGAVKAGKAAAGKVGAMGTFLGTLGSLIPGPMGASLRARSAALTQTQGNALAAIQAPVNAGHDLDSLKSQSGQLANVKPAAAGQAPAKGALPAQSGTTQTSAVTTSGPIADSPIPPSFQPRQNAKKIAAPGGYVVQTQPLEPGADTLLVLKIGSQKSRYPEGTFGYTLKSLQQPVENLTGEPLPVVKQGVISFPHIAAWHYWLAPALNTIILAIMLLLCVYIFKIIWL